LAAPMASLIGGNVIIGGTLGTSSRHPCVPLHPGWESLPQTIKHYLHDINNFATPNSQETLQPFQMLKYPANAIILCLLDHIII